MNRADYTRLHSAARLAQRTWWKKIGDKYATQYDRDSACDRMHAAIAKVPGGVGRPLTEAVMLDGWHSRRCRVRAAIALRKHKAHIADRLAAMQRFFNPNSEAA